MALDLLQVHAEQSAKVATHCARLLCESDCVWDALDSAAACALSYAREEMAAELRQRVEDINRVIDCEASSGAQRNTTCLSLQPEVQISGSILLRKMTRIVNELFLLTIECTAYYSFRISA